MKKYELLENDTVRVNGKTLYRIKALSDFSDVKAGDLGGYIEKEENLSHEGKSWVYDDALVFDDAYVFGNAKVSGHAKIHGHASVSANAKVTDYAIMNDNACAFDNAIVNGRAYIYDNVWVYGNSVTNKTLCGRVKFYNNVALL